MIIVGSKVTFIVPSADAKCDYADGEILEISYKNKTLSIRDERDKWIYDLITKDDILTFHTQNKIKQMFLKIFL
jgi:hypothetical protein